MPEDTFEVEVERVKIATDKALLVVLETGDETWVPRSVIHDDSEVWDAGHEGTLVVHGWWARKNGLS